MSETYDAAGNVIPATTTVSPEAAAAAAASTAAAATAAAAAGTKPWYEGLDAETIGHIQNRGWHEKTPAEAAAESVKAYRELERFRGVPGDQIARIPKDAADEAGWLALRTRLGVPNDKALYDFAGVEAPEADVAFARDLAAELHVPAADAKALLAAIVKRQTATSAATAAETTARQQTEQAALKANWGANFDAHMLAADQAAAALKVTPEQLATLRNVVGGAQVAEMFRDIASKIGEDRFVSGGGGAGAPGVGASGLLTKDQAAAQRQTLMNDTAWRESYLNGDAEKGRQMLALNTILVGDDTEASRGA